MLYRHIIDYCFSAHLGAGQAQTRCAAGATCPPLKTLAARKDKQARRCSNLPSRSDDLAAIETLAADIRKRFKHIVVAGSGGSGLSGRTLTQLQSPNRAAVSFSRKYRSRCDGGGARASRHVKHSCFLIISKSGTTVETLSQFYVLLEHVGKNSARKRARAFHRHHHAGR